MLSGLPKNTEVIGMNKAVELPIAEPVYSTYHYQGNVSAVISGNPSMRNWYLNNVMILNCTRKFLYRGMSPVVSVSNSATWENPYITSVSYPMKYLDNSVHRVIRAMLDDDFYVAFNGVDDYYVEGKSWYNEKHFIHDGLICGYDRDGKTYTIYAYDSSWICRKFRTPQADFEKGRKSGVRNGVFGEVCGLKVKPDIIGLDPRKICDGLKEYLDSSLDKYPLYTDEMVYGTAVHDYIAMYLNKLADRSIPYDRTDRRVFRMLWEHKRIMLERIIAVEDKMKMNREISSQYADVVKEADTLRMMYASHHMRARYPLLPTIRDRLITLKERERDLLTGFIEKTEEAMKK